MNAAFGSTTSLVGSVVNPPSATTTTPELVSDAVGIPDAQKAAGVAQLDVYIARADEQPTPPSDATSIAGMTHHGATLADQPPEQSRVHRTLSLVRLEHLSLRPRIRPRGVQNDVPSDSF